MFHDQFEVRIGATSKLMRLTSWLNLKLVEFFWIPSITLFQLSIFRLQHNTILNNIDMGGRVKIFQQNLKLPPVEIELTSRAITSLEG